MRSRGMPKLSPNRRLKNGSSANGETDLPHLAADIDVDDGRGGALHYWCEGLLHRNDALRRHALAFQRARERWQRPRTPRQSARSCAQSRQTCSWLCLTALSRQINAPGLSDNPSKDIGKLSRFGQIQGPGPCGALGISLRCRPARLADSQCKVWRKCMRMFKLALVAMAALLLGSASASRDHGQEEDRSPRPTARDLGASSVTSAPSRPGIPRCRLRGDRRRATSPSAR